MRLNRPNKFGFKRFSRVLKSDFVRRTFFRIERTERKVGPTVFVSNAKRRIVRQFCGKTFTEESAPEESREGPVFDDKGSKHQSDIDHDRIAA